jgi:Na+/H+-dicarboxylate symporter
LIGSNFHYKLAKQRLLNSLEAFAIAFSTMSSLVTLPFTLKATEENLGSKDLARTFITSTVNNHAVGDCMGLAILALVVYYIFNGTLPSFEMYITFCFFFALAQFGAVSIPGGTVILMLPFLESGLDFNHDMTSLVVGIALFMDCIGTSGNVLANCAFALLLKKMLHKYIPHTKKNGAIPVKVDTKKKAAKSTFTKVSRSPA